MALERKDVPAGNDGDGADETFLQDLDMRTGDPRVEEDEDADSLSFMPMSFNEPLQYGAEDSPSNQDADTREIESDDISQYFVNNDEALSVPVEDKNSAVASPLQPLPPIASSSSSLTETAPSISKKRLRKTPSSVDGERKSKRRRTAASLVATAQAIRNLMARPHRQEQKLNTSATEEALKVVAERLGEIELLITLENNTYDPLLFKRTNRPRASFHQLTISAVSSRVKKISGWYPGMAELIEFLERAAKNGTSADRPYISLMLIAVQQFSGDHPRIRLFCQNFIVSRPMSGEDKSNLFSNLLYLCMQNPEALQRLLNISRFTLPQAREVCKKNLSFINSQQAASAAENAASTQTIEAASNNPAQSVSEPPAEESKRDAARIVKIEQLITAQNNSYQPAAAWETSKLRDGVQDLPVAEVFKLVNSLSKQHSSIKKELIPFFEKALRYGASDLQPYINLMLNAAQQFRRQYPQIPDFRQKCIATRGMNRDDKANLIGNLLQLCLKKPEALKHILDISHLSLLQARRMSAAAVANITAPMSTATTMQALQAASPHPMLATPALSAQPAIPAIVLAFEPRHFQSVASLNPPPQEATSVAQASAVKPRFSG